MDHNTPSSSSRKSLNVERLMGYADESDAPLPMPISDYSGRSSRSSFNLSRSPKTSRSSKKSHNNNNTSNNSGHRRSGLRQGLKALLSPLTPGRKKRNVLDARSARGTRKSLSPKLFANSPKSAGGRKKYVMNKLAIQNLDDDEDEADSIDSQSPLPSAPKRNLSKKSLINKLAISNLDDDEDEEILEREHSGRSTRSISRRGVRRGTKKSLLLTDVFAKNHAGFLDDEEDEGDTALDEWRNQRRMAMSDDHVTCRDFQGNPKDNNNSSRRRASGIRSMFGNNSDKQVRYSIRKDDGKKTNDSLDLAMLILDEMEDSEEFDSKKFCEE